MPSTRDVAMCSPVACYQFSEEHGTSNFRLEKTAGVPFYVFKLIFVSDGKNHMIRGNCKSYCNICVLISSP